MPRCGIPSPSPRRPGPGSNIWPRSKRVLSSLTEKYRHKIKTVEELVAILGKRPRSKKVIMCHGVFDVVHPGHVRHLLYAKTKADVLISSIPADRHISKASIARTFRRSCARSTSRL